MNNKFLIRKRVDLPSKSRNVDLPPSIYNRLSHEGDMNASFFNGLITLSSSIMLNKVVNAITLNNLIMKIDSSNSDSLKSHIISPIIVALANPGRRKLPIQQQQDICLFHCLG